MPSPAPRPPTSSRPDRTNGDDAMRAPSRTIVIGAAAAAAVAATMTTTIAAVLEPDGVHLQAEWTNGGHAWLELEDRNVAPAICFIWDNELPDDGEGIESRILTRDGTPGVR